MLLAGSKGGALKASRVGFATVSGLLDSALEVAELIRSGAVTASEVVEESLRRIDELEPQLGAFTYVAHDSAVEAAALIGQADPRPFAGVPIAIKDNRAVAGMPLTMCS